MKKKPKRIQRKRTKGWRMPKDTVYIGRPSKWENPFSLELFTRENSIKLYERYLREQKLDEWATVELKGKNLCCWCPLDQPCHADILLELANK